MALGQLAIFHGSIVLFIGMLFGIPYGSSLKKKKQVQQKVEAWKLAHSSISGGGGSLIAVGAATHVLALTSQLATIMIYSWIVSSYSFALAVWLAALFKERGLGFEGTIQNKIVNLIYFLAVMTGFIAGGLLIFLACP